MAKRRAKTAKTLDGSPKEHAVEANDAARGAASRAERVLSRQGGEACPGMLEDLLGAEMLFGMASAETKHGFNSMNERNHDAVGSAIEKVGKARDHFVQKCLRRAKGPDTGFKGFASFEPPRLPDDDGEDVDLDDE